MALQQNTVRAQLRFEDLEVAIPQKQRVRFRGQVRAGERVVLRGASGCGKTTFLKCLAGLVSPSSGRYFFDGEDLTGLPPQALRAGLVFQSGALFPHLNVLENVSFGLRYAQITSDAKEREAIAREALKDVGLEALALRDVTTLSGGERQRVALLRSLLPKPRFLLLDEPLSAIDPSLRTELQNWILARISNEPVPMIIVTHDRDEAKRLGTRVVEWRSDSECLDF